MGDRRDDDIDFTRKEKHQQKLYNFGYKLGQKLASKGNKNNNHETPQPSKPKTTYRSKDEYVFFGNFPQNIKAKTVGIEFSLGGGQYMGNDENVYCKKVNLGKGKGYDAGVFSYAAENHIEGHITRYSDGQKIQDEEYFCVKPIKWYVIHRENGILTLLSENILFYSQYSKIQSSMLGLAKSGKSWQSSDIRTILNEDFYNTAFSDKERECILQTYLTTENDNKGFLAKTLSGNSSVDKVYMLSVDECKQYGLNSVDLAKHQTDFCGQYIDYETGSARTYYSPWMTRTIFKYSTTDELNRDAFVSPYIATGNGKIGSTEITIYNVRKGVVPVIRVKESDVKVYTSNNPPVNSEVKSNVDTSQTHAQMKKTSPKITLRQKIGNTVLCLVCAVLGLFVPGMFTNGGTASTLEGAIGIAYLIASIVFTWKSKLNIKILRIIAIFNFILGFILWMTLATHVN